MGILFLTALWVEHKSARGKSPANNPLVYSLSLAVYCTTWTYYGSVGQAAVSGLLFLTTYLGPTIAIILWWISLRKLVRLKNIHRITSIADFISARYDKSQSIAAMVTIIALVGIVPYISLQLKAVISTFTILTDDGTSTSWIGGHAGATIVLLMVAFTLIIGLRSLNPTESHEGMMVALALECTIKLFALLIVGTFVTFFMHDGFGDIFQRASQSPFRDLLYIGGKSVSFYTTWACYLVLSMSAILFLPRQFHLAVVENRDEKHILTAMWLLPLYMLLISLFVLPIALGGLLGGFPAGEADTFVLKIPLSYGKGWLSLLVFIGGVSAAAGMIMISSVTLSTMITNHLLLPFFEWFSPMGFMKRHLLKCRWAAAAGFILIGYWFEEQIGAFYTLVDIGLISFAAVLQFAPAILGGLFWRRGNKAGAILGLAAGFLVWCYTLLLPSFMKSGRISNATLANGPWGIQFLRPEGLFGVTGLDPLSHAVLWTMLFNVGLYFLGSLYFEETERERDLAEEFVGVFGVGAHLRRPRRRDANIDLAPKKGEIERLLGQYFPTEEVETTVRGCLLKTGALEASRISVEQLATLHNEVEKALAACIGSAAAHKGLQQMTIITPGEAAELSEVYSEILADLKINPIELTERIDYYQERERLLVAQAKELEEKVEELENEIRQRRLAEEALGVSEERYRTLVESTSDAILLVDANRAIISVNKAFLDLFGYELSEVEGKSIRIAYPSDESFEASGQKIRNMLESVGPFTAEWELKRKDETVFPVEGSYSAIRSPDGSILAYVAIIRDITEKKKAEEQLKAYRDHLETMVEERTMALKAAQKALVQNEKLKTLGAIAAEVAHEIRNPLMSIGGFALRLQRKNPGLPEADIIAGESRRLEKILDRINKYLRPVEMRPQRCPVNTVVAETLGLLSADLQRERVIWKLDLDPEQPIAYVDVDIVSEVIINVIRHIVKLMDNQGTLTVKTSESDQDIQIEFQAPIRGRQVKDPELLAMPFEETDESGGVPLSYRLLKSMGGFLAFAQEDDIMLFTVSMPKAQGQS
jgi:PAS domain S-box-containing protein